MQTLFNPLLFWGLVIGLPLLPLLIHLINMMRRRRVKWAAMEFLLASQKRNRTSVWFKQFLLLAMRMAAVLLLVLLLSHAGCQSSLTSLFGGRATHHYVLLDDSFSMSDRAAGATAFDEGKRFLRTLAVAAASENAPQRFTLIRFSRASVAGAGEPSAETLDLDRLADFNAEDVSADFDVLVEEKSRGFQATDLAVGPRDAMQIAQRLVRENDDERRLVYVVSDFRAKEWESPAQLNAALDEMAKAKAELHFVQCVREPRANLAVIDIAPAEETRAAGVPLFVNVKVKNFGAAAARKVQLKMQTTFHDDRASSLAEASSPSEADIHELPSIVIDEIRPGETVSRRVQVFFPRPGRHVVEAILPEDAVSSDNRRWCVIDFPDGEPVLIVDGSANSSGGRNAYFLQAAFEPGLQTITGVRPTVQTEAFLRDATADALHAFTAIYLLDVGRLDPRAVENLENYAKRGGGVAFFLGEQVGPTFYNEKLYRNGEGLFPLPIAGDDLLPAEVENVPDIQASDHPVFGVALGERNPLIRLVTVDRYVKPREGWRPDPDSTVQIIAKLRNQLPLAVEKQYGAGRVVAFLTTCAPQWNNWAKNPSFVVTILKLQSHLAAAQRLDEARLAGAPIELELESQQYLPNVLFTAPGDEFSGRLTIERAAARAASDSPLMTASLGAINKATGAGETDRAGVYEARLKTAAGEDDVRRFAVNVDPAESDLALPDVRTLLAAVEPVQPQVLFADEFSEGQITASAGDSFNRLLSFALLCGLAMLLLGEQVVGCLASYHPARGVQRA